MPARLQALQQELAPARDPGSEDVKNELKQATQAAIARGLFGVPTFAVDDKLFWGFDALPMLRAYLQGDDWFAANWDSAAQAAAAPHQDRARQRLRARRPVPARRAPGPAPAAGSSLECSAFDENMAT